MKYLEKLKQNTWILGILFVAAFLRFHKLGFQSAWLDEVHTLRVSDPALSFREFYDDIIFTGGIPHFYFLIIRFLSNLFGSGIYVARIPSAIAGVLTVWVIYLLGKELMGKQAGYMAALFLTLNLVHIEYSQEARSYTILAFFASLAFYRMVRFIREMTLRNALLMGLCTGLIAHAQPVGLINAATIYLILFVVLIFGGYRTNKKMLLYCFYSGILSLLVVIPVYPIIQKISSITALTNSFIPKLSFDSLKDLFIILASGSVLILWLVAFSMIFFCFMAARSFEKQNKSLQTNKVLFAFTIAFLWFWVEFISIVLKSYYSDPVLLPRYLLAIVPAMMLILAMGIDLARNTILKIILIAAISGMMLFKLFSTNYYTAITKNEFKKVTGEVTRHYIQKDKIVSVWGWLLTYYFNKEERPYVIESDFHEYIRNMKADAIVKKPFWYIDGNFRPYDLNSEEEQFLKQYFVMDRNIDMYYNAWARHYSFKKAGGKPEKLSVKDFEPHMENANGDLLMFENGTFTSEELEFEAGQYELTISGYSAPQKPINGENAHIVVKLGDAVIGQFYLSENPDSKINKFTFKSSEPQNAQIKFVFDNDILIDGKDRNAVFTSVSLRKKASIH